MRLAAYTLRGERFQDLEESLARVDAVTLDEVNAACAHYFGPEDQYVLSLGPEGLYPRTPTGRRVACTSSIR